MLTDINVKIFNVRFVVEQRNKKKYKKPSVIHALGNIKWGFTLLTTSRSRTLPWSRTRGAGAPSTPCTPWLAC